MRIEEIEIHSDQTNAAIMRHPGRRFPGLLIQGDTLFSLWWQADRACAVAHGRLTEDEYHEIEELRDRLRAYLDHYKRVLEEHQIQLPFSSEGL